MRGAYICIYISLSIYICMYMYMRVYVCACVCVWKTMDIDIVMQVINIIGVMAILHIYIFFTCVLVSYAQVL